MPVFRLICSWSAIAILLVPPPVCARAVALRNRGLAIEIDSRSGSLILLTNQLTQEAYKTRALPFLLETSLGLLSAADASASRLLPDGIEFTYDLHPVHVGVRYRLVRERDFFEKLVKVENRGPSPLIVRKVVLERIEFAPAFEEVRPHDDPGLFRRLINLFLRGRKGGFYFGIQNPVYRYWTRGATSGTTWVQLEYDANTLLRPGQSYVTDASFTGAFRKERVYLFKELGKLRAALRSPGAIPAGLNFEQEILDWGEVWAMQDFIRAIQPPHDFLKPGFYVRGVAWVGGRGPVKGSHIAFGPEHVEGSKRFVDELTSLGHVPHIEWSTEWFGVGGYANPTEGLLLESAGPGDPVPVNPYWLEVVKYGLAKGLHTGIFETVARNFARRQSDWKVLGRDGKPKMWGEPPQPMNCWANRNYVKWRLDVTEKGVRDYELYMVAWDAVVPRGWSWLGWPEVETECFAENHGHLPGDTTYPIFRNIVWFLEQLQERHPRLALRVASGLTTAYPWVLKNLIEYHPNLYDGETGATYWTSYNFRFLPLYKSGVLLSANSKAQLEWLLLRSISVSDHFMLWPDALPIAVENRPFWTKWMNWADRNIDYLRVGRTLFREPWGDNVVASLPAALEGRLPYPAAALHGIAHCIKDRGYLFVFNPSSQARVGVIPMNHWIGLTEDEQFSVQVVHPDSGAAYGPYRRGEELRIEVPAHGVLVLHVAPATAQGAQRRPLVSSSAPVDKAFLTWEEIPWHEIHPAP